jgi:iron-regulated transporter 1
LSKIADGLSQLFVSLLTTLFGYTTATLTLLALAIGSFALEYWWIEVVFKRFPMLQNEEPSRRDNETQSPSSPDITPPQRQFSIENAMSWLRHERDDWLEFARLPVFASSLAIASIYLTTLSYDGAFIAYIKAARGWDDGFIAAMRGLCVVTGMVGTVVMPMLENRIGLVRAGSWSIW